MKHNFHIVAARITQFYVFFSAFDVPQSTLYISILKSQITHHLHSFAARMTKFDVFSSVFDLQQFALLQI